MVISDQRTMMIEPPCSLEDACRQAHEMINQVSRHHRDVQGQGQSGLDITLDSLSRSAVISQKKEQSYSKQSIQSKLTRLYFEELSQAPHATPDSILNNLENECDLLGRLVQKDGLHTLIVNLYAGNKGYSLGVRNSLKGIQYDKNTSVSETQLMGYEQGELLSCIDNGQLPAMLAEQLEVNHSHLFYDGCIIAEVRDYRKAYPHNKPEIHHVLLKPNTQSVLSDVSTLTSDGDWSHEERLILESRLIAATQGPLCLDPNPIPGLATTRSRQSKALLADHQLVRQAKKFSQVTVNRKRKLEQLAQPEGLTIQDLMQKIRAKRGGASMSTVCPAPSLSIPPLLPPSTPVDVMRYAKAYEQPRETKDCLPQLIEEYILETERGQGRIYHIKLSILQRPSNSEYLGELYVDIDYREGEKKGSSCRFTLGTRAQANHYIQQFTEIFTEEGRKNVKIQHVVPGQAPRVTCTPGMQRAQQQAQQQQQVQQQLQQQQQQQAPNVQRVHQQVKAHLVAQQLQQVQSQRVAQQILSRAQGQLNTLAGGQLNTLAGQVANSIKAMTEAAASGSRQPTSLVNCLDNVAQSIPGIVQNDPVAVNVEQALTCNTATPRVATATSLTGQTLENATANAVTMATTDMAPCNGSAGILVFQQKPAPAPAPSNTSSVPVLQAQLQAGTLTDTANHNDVTLRSNSTNLAISALATSLMNSAQQFTQQQAAANAAAAAASMNNTATQAAPKSNNAAILSLLNSTPANLTQQKNQARRISLNTASIPQRVLSHGNVITVPSTSGPVRVSFSSPLGANQLSKQQPVKATAVRLARVQDPTSALGLSMPGLSALLAGTPTEDNSVPGITAASSLFERLTATSANQSSQPASPMTSPPPVTPPTQQTQQQQPTNVNLQGVNLASLPNSINGLQNVQVSIPGLSQPITMSLNVSAATGGGNVVTPGGVIVSLPISSATNTCSTVSSMPATVVTTAVAGGTPTVVIANSANTHLSLPIAQLIPSGVKGLTQQSIRSNNAAVTLAQGGQAIQLVGSHRSRIGQMARQVQSNQAKSLSNQLMTVSKAVTTNHPLLLNPRNKQILTPIMVAPSKPMLMATQTGASSSQSAISTAANKQTLLAKSLHARSASAATMGQCNSQAQALNAVTGLSQQQLQQLQQCLAAQQKATIATANASATSSRTQIQPRGSTGGDDVL